MLYIIGTGLGSYKDISLKSMEIIKSADTIYQECYTCTQPGTDLEEIAGKRIIPANRKLVEEHDEIVEEAKSKLVVFLVSGTPLFATTHTDIVIRAKTAGVPFRIIHNISIMNVMGSYGLFSYNFGRTVSIPYFDEQIRPISFYDNIHTNMAAGLHTLCLLDIKTDENRFMSANVAIDELLYAESVKQKGIITEDTEVFVVCRFATENEYARFDSIKNLQNDDFGGPLHSLIIPGRMSEIEREFVDAMMK